MQVCRGVEECLPGRAAIATRAYSDNPPVSGTFTLADHKSVETSTPCMSQPAAASGLQP